MGGSWVGWYILDDHPPPRMPVANEGLGRDSLLKMVHSPGGDCYWVGGRPKVYLPIYGPMDFTQNESLSF